MKKVFLSLFTLLIFINNIWGADTLSVYEPRYPILIEREDNILFYLRVDAKSSKLFEAVELTFDAPTDISKIESIKLYYSGTEGAEKRGQKRFFPINYLSFTTPNGTLSANRSYSVLQSEISPVSTKLTLTSRQELFPGVNYFWVSIKMKPETPLTEKIACRVEKVLVDGGVQAPIERVTAPNITHRMGVGVRHAGDGGSVAFRIPGVVTTNNGTLLAVYDVRYNSSKDLQEHIDIGLSRSTDGGKTWEKMTIPLTFGNDGGLPSAQNGVGDPAILVDRKTNKVWIIAAWTHGMGNNMAWWNSMPGTTKNETSQLVLACSDDDGKSFSAPINITSMVKDPSWYFLLQGPGMGISMEDGTLVFPIQFIDSTRVPNAGIMYSKDGGEKWAIHNLARTNTTESQVAELPDGSLMLNMRDNRGGSRAVSVTKDFGKTWSEHPSSRSLLQEPVCMASLISVRGDENILGRDLLIFSNPNTVKGRYNITIKISLDGGSSWLPEHQILLDEGENWGYSCLTMIDNKTIGILYESSVAMMTFQAIPLMDFFPQERFKTITQKMEGVPGDASFSQGVSSFSAGVLGESLIVAGGCNFPSEPLIKGGKKQFYDNVFAASLTPGARKDVGMLRWEEVGKLPEALAYSATVTTPKGLIVAGGSNDKGTSSKVYRLSIANGKGGAKQLKSEILPSLPFTFDNGAGVLIGNRLYVLGGNINGVPTTDMYSIDLKKRGAKWQKEPSFPGAPRLQPLCIVQKRGGEESLFLFGGFVGGMGDAAPKVSTESLVYTPSTGKWSSAATPFDEMGAPISLGGGVGAAFENNKIFCLGGVNVKVFGEALALLQRASKLAEKGDIDGEKKAREEFQKYLSQDPAAYKLNARLLIYDTESDSWEVAESVEGSALAGASLVPMKGGKDFLLLHGEIKPGVRSNETLKITLAQSPESQK